MFLLKQGYPADDDLVLCTVTKVQFHSVFVTLDEYNKQGMIHISEIAPGRIRNIRDFVVEGKKIVCKVLKINEERGHIDLSLRRVNERQKREKIDEIKQEQIAEKIIELVAKKLGKEPKKFYNELSENILKKYETFNLCFQDVVKKEGLLDKLGIKNEYILPLEEAIKARIREVQVEINGILLMYTYNSEGVNIIKEAINKIEEIGKGKISISYSGGGRYNINVKSKDYKIAEKLVNSVVEAATKFIEKHQGTCSFARVEE